MCDFKKPSTTLLLTLCALSITFAEQAQANPHDTQPMMIVMDMSGSMGGQLNNGGKKIEVLRQAVTDNAIALSQKRPLGLISFGHQNLPNECSDIETLLPLAVGNREHISEAFLKHKPAGGAPLSQALQKAAKTLGRTQSSILLLTDSTDSCAVDPCTTASALKIQNPLLTINVLSMGGDEEQRADLQCVADMTGGYAYQVESADHLHIALGQLMRNHHNYQSGFLSALGNDSKVNKHALGVELIKTYQAEDIKKSNKTLLMGGLGLLGGSLVYLGTRTWVNHALRQEIKQYNQATFQDPQRYAALEQRRKMVGTLDTIVIGVAIGGIATTLIGSYLYGESFIKAEKAEADLKKSKTKILIGPKSIAFQTTY
ncbi:MAG: VWA domain-containing protein [Myxococcota bacterium]|jgi:hypothetical protein|nr:VWA domain-containing protein [Myxococcota bacterium]